MDTDSEDIDHDTTPIGSDNLPVRASGPWAKEKLDALKYYVDLFTVGMKPSKNKKFNWASLVYIDLFAGPGRCKIEGTNKEFDGSPLIALKSPHPFSKIYLIEQDPKLLHALRTRTKGDPRCVFIGENCNQAISSIIKDRESKTLYLAFIDPTGLDINFSTLKTLTEEIPCDLIINWFYSAIARNRGQWLRTRRSDKLDRFFGTNSWINYISESKSERAICRDWVQLYRNQLTRIGYSYQGEPLVIKNTKGGELYWLWYASKSKLGLSFWNKTKKNASKEPELF